MTVALHSCDPYGEPQGPYPRYRSTELRYHFVIAIPFGGPGSNTVKF